MCVEVIVCNMSVGSLRHNVVMTCSCVQCMFARHSVKTGLCVYRAALPQPPADFFNLGVTGPASVPSSSASSDSQPPIPAPGYRMPPMPMFRPPVGMIPPHLPMGPRRPPPPPPRMGGPPPGRPFPPGMYDGFTSCIAAST